MGVGSGVKPTVGIDWETDLRESRREAVVGNLSREEAERRRAVELASSFVREDRQNIDREQKVREGKAKFAL